MSKTTLKALHARAYLGEMSRLARARQLEICKTIVDDIEGGSALDSIYESKEFDLFVRNLRPDEVAVLPRLMALAEIKPEGNRRPGIAFFMRLIKLLEAPAYIAVTHPKTGEVIRSIDGQKWLDHVEKTASAIMRGRELSTEQASALAKKSHEDRAPGLVAEWESIEKSEERKRMASHWRDPEYKSAKAAIAASPD